MRILSRFGIAAGLGLILLWGTWVQPCFPQTAAALGAPEDIYRQAYASYQKGEYQAALDSCKAVLTQKLDHWMALQVAAYASYQLKDTASAENYARRSLVFHPDNPALQSFLDKISPPLVPPPPVVDPSQTSSFAPPPPVAVHFGFEAGGNMSNVIYGYQSYSGLQLDSHFGFSGGLALRLDFGPVFSLQPELFYTQKGFTFNEYYYSYYYGAVISEYQYRVTVALNYLEMPILLKFSIPSQRVRPNVFVGISPGLNVGGSITDGSTGLTIPYPSSYLNSFEASVILGMGLDIGRVSISARFEQGLTGIYSGYSSGEQVENQLFNFMVGYFPI